MINDLDVSICPLQPYEFSSTFPNICSDKQLEQENSFKNHRISSQCLHLKKKIKRKPSRPSLLRIDESVRNVKLYNIVTSQTNLDNQENIQKIHHQ